jgi:hypothetical protein
MFRTFVHEENNLSPKPDNCVFLPEMKIQRRMIQSRSTARNVHVHILYAVNCTRDTVEHYILDRQISSNESRLLLLLLALQSLTELSLFQYFPPLLSVLRVQFLTPMFFTSSSTDTSHLNLGFPTYTSSVFWFK